MLLEMRDVCKDYPQGRDTVRVLRDVNLQVEEGDYIAIMGPSGSGKTTLMNLIGCLDVPTSGEYLLDGVDVGSATSNQLATLRNQMLGFVFQSFYLLPKLSAVDNVALPLLYAGVPKKERRARAIEALEKMGLGERLNFRPNQLSGGQCQRVAIARAIVGQPKLLLADEPTGALDTASGEQIMDIFRQLNEDGTTILMITHEQAIAEHARSIHYIRDGILTSPHGASSVGSEPFENVSEEEILEQLLQEYREENGVFAPLMMDGDFTLADEDYVLPVEEYAAEEIFALPVEACAEDETAAQPREECEADE